MLKLNYVIPFIERLASGEPVSSANRIMKQVHGRCSATRVVMKHLRGEGSSNDYYKVLCELLATQEYRRLLLYLPFSDLENAPNWFKETYLDTWYDLLGVQDARENFFEGDTYEPSARPGGKLERIVKCAHLTPWLVKAGYISYTDLKSILSLNRDNEILLRSFANTWRIINDLRLLPSTEMRVLEGLTRHVSQRARLEPLYVSEKREKWLREREIRPEAKTLLTPHASLVGPFSPNIWVFMEDLESIQSKLGPEEIALVTGSRLKGYGTSTSDWDIFKLQQLDNDPVMIAGSPHAAFVYYDAIWLGGSNVNNLSEVATSYATAYFERSDRHLAIERLETDLLQYRLLHKGFVNFYGGHDSLAKDYPEMDGDCPFYDEKYRKMATELFVKYVFIPTNT